MLLDTPFHTRFRPHLHTNTAIARRPVLARALRADVTTPALGVVLAWGEPYIGKTTLVRQVLWSLEPERYVVSRLPLGALAEPITGFCRAGRLLGEQVAVQLALQSEEAESVRRAQSLPQTLHSSMEIVAKHGKTLVIAVEGVDRYVGGTWPAGVMKHLALILSRSPELALILTSRLPLARLEAIEVPEQVRVHFIPPLDRAEASQLLSVPFRGSLEIDDVGLELLLSAAGGRPLLLQIIGRNCQRIARAVDTHRISQKLAEEIQTTCWLAGEQVFRPLIGNLLPNTQRALAATALATSPALSNPPFERIFHHLRLLGGDVSLAAFANELNLLRLWRLLDSDDEQSFYVSCGWLGEFLRAGVSELDEIELDY